MNGEELKTEEAPMAQQVTSTNKNKTKPRKDPGRCLINVRTTVRKTVRSIARNQGHFEPTNNYQRYIVLHSGTIEYQENSILRRSRLDLERRVFRTMTCTI